MAREMKMPLCVGTSVCVCAQECKCAPVWVGGLCTSVRTLCACVCAPAHCWLYVWIYPLVTRARSNESIYHTTNQIGVDFCTELNETAPNGTYTHMHTHKKYPNLRMERKRVESNSGKWPTTRLVTNNSDMRYVQRQCVLQPVRSQIYPLDAVRQPVMIINWTEKPSDEAKKNPFDEYHIHRVRSGRAKFFPRKPRKIRRIKLAYAFEAIRQIKFRKVILVACAYVFLNETSVAAFDHM